MNNKLIRNITLSALMIGLGLIFERLIVISIPPMIRIGIGSIPVIISSVILGPIYGAFIGASVDVLGFFVFDTSGFPYTPFVTISFVLMGVLPYFLFKLTTWMRFKKKPFPITYGVLGLIWAFILVYVLLNDTIKITSVTYAIDIYWKVLIPIISFIVFAAFSVFVYLVNRYFQKKVLFYPKCPSPHEVAFVVLVIEIIVHMLWGSFWKGIFFNVSPLVVFFVQSVVLIIAFPIKTLALNYVLMAYYRYIDRARSDQVE